MTDMITIPEPTTDEGRRALAWEDYDRAAVVGKTSLASRFIVPPFTVLDARGDYWQARKRSWMALGIVSEVGRGDSLLYGAAERVKAGKTDIVSTRIMQAGGGTSVFDPVLCELVYRWFSPKGGTVLDPFAGGSVRGVVAAWLGRKYVGIELRPEQVAANRQQCLDILGLPSPAPGMAEQDPVGTVPDVQQPASTPVYAPPPLGHTEATPVERRGSVWLKREDAYECGGARGGKARAVYQLVYLAPGVVTAGKIDSPHLDVVVCVAQRLGRPVRVHLPLVEGEEFEAEGNVEFVYHEGIKPSGLAAAAQSDAQARAWAVVPYGLACDEYVLGTASQVDNLPFDEGLRRVVVPVDTGLTLAGVLIGLARLGKNDVEVVGVVTGADPSKRLDYYVGDQWRARCSLVRSLVDQDEAAESEEWEGVRLDPSLEAKCLPYLVENDCLWVSGWSSWLEGWTPPLGHAPAPPAPTPLPRPPQPSPPAPPTPLPPPTWVEGDSTNCRTLAPGEYDLLFTCPPYADLEVYSDDPRDLSNMDYDHFAAAYLAIIREAVQMLKPNRFAVCVVGEVRAPDGTYRNFVGDTIRAFREAGLPLYNEGIIVTPAGSLPLRAGGPFAGSRKLGKTHQQVLVFVKGDPKQAATDFGVDEDLEAPLPLVVNPGARRAQETASQPKRAAPDGQVGLGGL